MAEAELALGALLGLVLAVLVLRAVTRLAARRRSGISARELNGWFRRRRP